MQAQAETEPTDAAGPVLAAAAAVAPAARQRRADPGRLFFALSLTAYLVDQAIHRNALLTWYDLNVYNDAGLITRQLPSILYTWELKGGVQFTYTPFAAVVFAGGSLLPLDDAPLDHDDVQPGRRSADRLAHARRRWAGAAPAGSRPRSLSSALALWTEPVVKALFLGQIEPLLMLLVVWDLTRKD